ncbi:MAG: tetratricopeptide repeat protein [Flavobacteriales bacterium]|nr:tetratricopeptide repeat protein [Flavobacteriales bacterium]
MSEDQEWFENEELASSVSRFEEMLRNNTHYFFDIEEFENLVDFYIETNNTTKALKVVNYAKEQHPFSTEMAIRHAQVLAAAHKPQQALEILASVESLISGDTDFYFTKATIYSQLRMSQKAIDNFKKALEFADHNEDKEDVLISIAFEYENLSEFNKAVEYLKKTLTINPNNETALYEIVFCYEVLGQLESCIDYFNHFIDEHPYSYNAWYNLGISYNHIGLYEKSLEAFEYALTIQEEFPAAHYSKASTLVSLARYEEAIESFKETMKYEEPDALCFYNIGECYEKLEDYNNALGYYQRATKLDPYFGDAWMGIAYVYNQTNRLYAAAHYIEKAAEIDNKNEDYLYLYADIKRNLGFIEEAIEAYKTVIQLAPDNESAYIDLTEAYMQQNEHDLALETITEAAQLFTESSTILYKLAWVLIELRFLDEALLAFEKAIEIRFGEHKEFLAYCPKAALLEGIISLIEKHNPSNDI